VAEKYKVKVTVKSITKGECSRGFKPGDSWIIENGETPSGMCGDAYTSIAPAISVFEPHPLCPPLLVKERGISIKKEGLRPS